MQDGWPVVQSIDLNSQLKGRHDFEEPRLMLPRETSAYSSPFHSRKSSVFLLIWIYIEEMNGLYNEKGVRVGNILVQRLGGTTISLVSGRFVEG